MGLTTFALLFSIVGQIALIVTVLRQNREIRALENRWAEHVRGRST